MPKQIIKGSLYYGGAIPNLDSKYGPYESTEAAFNKLGPDGDDVLTIGLTVGIIEDGKISEYWFESACNSSADLIKKDKHMTATVDEDNKKLIIY